LIPEEMAVYNGSKMGILYVNIGGFWGGTWTSKTRWYVCYELLSKYEHKSILQIYLLKMMVFVFSHTKTAIFRPSKTQIKFQKTQKTCFVQNKNGHFWDIIFEPRF
jgi:hypothetical protein